MKLQPVILVSFILTNMAPPFKAVLLSNVEFEIVAFLPSMYTAPPPRLFSLASSASAMLLLNSLEVILIFSPMMCIAPPSVGMLVNAELGNLKSVWVA